LARSSSNSQGGLSPANWEKGSTLLNHIGYAILIFSLVDYGGIVVPFRFTNPAWELEVIKQLINQVVVLLVGFGLVFYRPMTINRGLTKYLLRILSWLCLLIGIFYLLLLPLAFINVGRVGLIQQNNVNDRLNQQIKVNDQLVKQISRPGITDKELQLWAREAQLTPQALAKDREANISLQQSILTQLKTAKERVQTQATTTINSAQKQNLKDTISIILRGLISAVIFIWMWYITGWARKLIRKSRRKPRSTKNFDQLSTQTSDNLIDNESEIAESEEAEDKAFPHLS
jgi:hypothetical protein